MNDFPIEICPLCGSKLIAPTYYVYSDNSWECPTQGHLPVEYFTETMAISHYSVRLTGIFTTQDIFIYPYLVVTVIGTLKSNIFIYKDNNWHHILETDQIEADTFENLKKLLDRFRKMVIFS